MNKKQLRALRKKKLAEARAILDATIVSRDAEGGVSETRDMSADEKKRYDAALAEARRCAVGLRGLRASAQGDDEPEDPATRDAEAEAEDDEDDEDDDEAEDDEDDDEAEPEEPVRSRRRPAPAHAANLPRRRNGRRSRPMGDGPAIHTRGQERYSVLRAIRSVIETGRPSGLEAEVSDEVLRRSQRTGRTIPAGQFHMPMGLDPELRELMHPGSAERDRRRAEQRDVTTTTAAGSIFTAPEATMIELLRARLVLRRLGITVLDDLQGIVALMRQTGGTTVNWVGEGVSASPSNPTWDNVPFSPHTAIALTNISYMLTLQTSLSVDNQVKNDLAAQMARACDATGFNGTGGAQPTGLFQVSGIQTRSAGIQMGANGGNPTYAALVAMESLVATANADFGNLAYVTTSAARGFLKQAPIIGTTFPEFLWAQGSGNGPGVGELNNYPALVSNLLLSNITKGTGTNLSQIAFGNWDDMVMGVWDDAMTFLVNPYTNQANGGVTISTTMAVDFNFRHYESFAIITDVKTV